MQHHIQAVGGQEPFGPAQQGVRVGRRNPLPDGLARRTELVLDHEVATEQEYIDRVRDWDWSRLRALWDAVESNATPDWDPGKALEYLVLRAFQLDGAEVTWP
jgi:hypothetical protein